MNDSSHRTKRTLMIFSSRKSRFRMTYFQRLFSTWLHSGLCSWDHVNKKNLDKKKKNTYKKANMSSKKDVKTRVVALLQTIEANQGSSEDVWVNAMTGIAWYDLRFLFFFLILFFHFLFCHFLFSPSRLPFISFFSSYIFFLIPRFLSIFLPLYILSANN